MPRRSRYEPLDVGAAARCKPIRTSRRVRCPGLDRDTFRQVVEVKFTVYYSLIGIGEALKEGVPGDFLASEPTIPWTSIVGMRNRLVHAYWRIDDDVVYDVATIELPALGVALDRIIKRHA